MKKYLISTATAAYALALSAAPVFAAPGSSIVVKPIGPWDKLQGLTFAKLISGLITYALIFAALIFFFMLLIGGIQWMLSGGDKAGTEAARGRITAALIGLVVVFSAWAIASLIETVFGIPILKFDIPSIFS